MKKKIWKLGIQWGTGQKPFLPFIEKKKIVLSDTKRNQYYSIGDLVLICKGFTVLGIAEVRSKLQPITQNKDFEVDCNNYNIHYEDWVYYAAAKYYLFQEKDQFQYKLRKGTAKVRQENIKKRAKELYEKYSN
ncbi:hypothetical protein [Aureispira anguillae]|uniref:ASCH domain-containing protein n=1 Tax=Aureispira anguillae TaxID=2864201 RepID=A0A915YGG7_9BACT|nr:hypothetical protein [Aureispira anguillae]BDS12703.1 hypothetical protein AsAng_0034280 [Aureispira anguillae]